MIELLMNTDFYGKKVFQFDNLEGVLFVNDILLTVNGEYIFRQNKMTINIGGRDIELGTMATQIMLSIARVDILKMMLGITDDEGEDLVEYTESTKYSYQGFLRSLTPLMKYSDEVTFDDLIDLVIQKEEKTEFPFDFSMN